MIKIYTFFNGSEYCHKACFFNVYMLESYSANNIWRWAVLAILKIVVNALHIIFAVFIIAFVLLQSSKSAGLSGVMGGNNDTFFGKNKGRDYESMFGRFTSIVAILFLITSVTLFILLKGN